MEGLFGNPVSAPTPDQEPGSASLQQLAILTHVH